MKPIRFTARLATSACLVLAANTVSAAEEPVGQIMRIDGTAMISQGTRYVDAREGTPLRAQDRVLVLEGGSALLQFTDGCEYTIEDSQMLTIGTESVCAEQAVKTAAAEQGGVSVEGAAASGQQSFAGIEQGATSQFGGAPGAGYVWSASTGTWIFVGLGTAGVIAALADGTASDDREFNNQPSISRQ